jgi:hypothetical protein
MTKAEDIIERLGLAPHPEGGWFRESWRAPAEDGERARATTVLFLLERGQASHWHKVDATEIWLFQAGDPLELSFAGGSEGPVQSVTLGPDVVNGQSVKHVLEPHEWQAARPTDGPAGYTLVTCIVSPGFEFEGFTLAPPDWAPGTRLAE